MTTKQRITLMADLWPRACAVKGWNPQDRELRLKVLGQAVGRELESASEINNTNDFDNAKAFLLAIYRPADLESQVAIANMDRTRLYFAIRKLAHEITPAEVRSYAFESPYADAVMRDKYGHNDPDRLSPEQLEQFRNTLAARLAAKRRKERLENQPF